MIRNETIAEHTSNIKSLDEEVRVPEEMSPVKEECTKAVLKIVQKRDNTHSIWEEEKDVSTTQILSQSSNKKTRGKESHKFACQACGSSFTNRNRLTIHLRNHVGIKPFSCDICQKKFTRSDNLKQHLTIHSGTKPYTCDICDKTFNRLSNAKLHNKTHIKGFDADK